MKKGGLMYSNQAVKILMAGHLELREPGPDSSEGLVDQVYSILKGINRDETYAEDEGWWETSEGAEFGARKLSEIVDLVSEAERQLAEKDEYHEAYKEEYLDTLKELCELCTEKDAEIRMWKERVIEWQDVDSSNQDEIERLRDIAYPPGY